MKTGLLFEELGWSPPIQTVDFMLCRALLAALIRHLESATLATVAVA